MRRRCSIAILLSGAVAPPAIAQMTPANRTKPTPAPAAPVSARPTESRSIATKPLSATFPVTVAVTINGEGSVTVGDKTCVTPVGQTSTMCSLTLTPPPGGGAIPLAATPAGGRAFLGWAGACSGPQARCQLSGAGNSTIAATFGASLPKAPNVKVTVLIPTAGGSVGADTFATGSITCRHDLAGYYGGTCEESVPLGSKVFLKATPQGGATFAGWSSADPGCNGATCTITVQYPITLTAKFDPPGYELRVSWTNYDTKIYQPKFSPYVDCQYAEVLPATADNATRVTCGQQFPYGTKIDLTFVGTVTKPDGSKVAVGPSTNQWGGDCKGAATTCHLTLNGDKTVTLATSP